MTPHVKVQTEIGTVMRLNRVMPTQLLICMRHVRQKQQQQMHGQHALQRSRQEQMVVGAAKNIASSGKIFFLGL
jgi:hypothetical protein